MKSEQVKSWMEENLGSVSIIKGYIIPKKFYHDSKKSVPTSLLNLMYMYNKIDLVF